jgi:hypothetical protein
MSYCPWCSQKLDPHMKSCPVCGKANIVLELTRRTTVEKDDEHIYYSDNKGVLINSTKIIIPIRTDRKGRLIYNIEDISSVKIKLVNSSFPTSVIMIAAGLVLSIVGLLNMTLLLILPGIVLSTIGAIWALIAHWIYYLVISSTSGSADALVTEDVQYAYLVYEAINKALSNRS